MKVYNISRPDLGGGGYTVVNPWGVVASELECTEIGDSLLIEVVEMTEGEYDSLPEFEGW